MTKYVKLKIINNIIAVVIAIIFLFPLYWVIISSLKTDAEIFALNPTLIPKNIVFTTYTEQFTGGEYNILRGLINSLIISIPTMIISVLISVPAAYGLARFNVWGRKFLIQSFLLTQIMPATLLLTPMFILFRGININNTYMAPIIANCTVAIPFSVMMLRPYFLTLPKEVEEAAVIDGCSVWTSFLKIMLPLSYPGIIMSSIFSFLFAWGDLIYSLTFISDGSMRPITVGIYNFVGKYGISWNKIMAFGVVIMIPVILIFIFLQKYIIGGLTQGSVKE
ncbi:carbohydrate ABC transporter permease [Oceanivirga salmonicida]|uniref:carbohydrate ABC transporter permease n=1 Tax=Oceanivirga salmonicida TaxID=1769291 RepID=UPI0012E300B2|nr:carbohydrate ABC transporter permease [Oceanivirga salmonicida]